MPTLAALVSPRFRITVVSLTALLAMGCAGGLPGMGEDKPRLPPEGAYQVDTPHTFVQFTAQHQVVGRVVGRFDRTTGIVTIDDDLANCRVDISIDARSINTQQTARDDDLRGADFFDTDNYPTIEYHGRGIRKSQHRVRRVAAQQRGDEPGPKDVARSRGVDDIHLIAGR